MSSGFSSLPTLTTFYNTLLSKAERFLFASESKLRVLEQGYGVEDAYESSEGLSDCSGYRFCC